MFYKQSKNHKTNAHTHTHTMAHLSTPHFKLRYSDYHGEQTKHKEKERECMYMQTIKTVQ